jgi:hypothetical protein
MLKVESAIAPFIAAAANIPGATKSSKSISVPPGPATSPTRAPIPTPIDSR